MPFATLYTILFLFLLCSVPLILLHTEAAMLGVLSHRIRTPLTSIKWCPGQVSNLRPRA